MGAATSQFPLCPIGERFKFIEKCKVFSEWCPCQASDLLCSVSSRTRDTEPSEGREGGKIKKKRQKERKLEKRRRGKKKIKGDREKAGK